MQKKVYFIPVIDVSWNAFGPLNPRKNYSHESPPLNLCVKELEVMLDLMVKLYNGNFAVAIHTGTYCRDSFTEEPFLSIWHQVERIGGELLIHTHEEIAAKGTLNSNEQHMKKVIYRQFDRLKSANLHPVGYRGGLYGFAPFLTSYLEELGLNVDLTPAPGFQNKERNASWSNCPFSAFYLGKGDDLVSPKNEIETSSVLSIPLGASGSGTDNTDYLYIDYDLSTLKSILSIWNAILDRAQKKNTPQFVHTLFHTNSMSNREMLERYRYFTETALVNGKALTPTKLVKRFSKKG